MAIRNVLTDDDPLLRKKSKPVKEVTDHIKEVMQDMLETMREKMGVGIAAPQVGVLRRMFIAEPEPGVVFFMINPEMLEQDGEELGEEGCLSVPGKMGMVERPSHIRMRAQDLDGETKEFEFEDFYARVMCHEYDHLEGVLYTDKAERVYVPEEHGEEEQEESEL